MSVGNEIVAGTIAGLARGLVMIVAMAAGKQTGITPRSLPRKFRRELEARRRRPGTRRHRPAGE